MQPSDSGSPAPPPAEKRSGRRKAFLVTAVVLTLIIVILLAAFPVLFPKPEPSSTDGLVTHLGLRVNQTSPGNWTITVVSGGSTIYKASSVRLTVMNQTTGEATVNKVVSKLAPARNDPDAVYNDRNDNSKIDAGDTIVLKASGGHIIAGYKVQFFIGNDIVGTIRDLPAEIG